MGIRHSVSVTGIVVDKEGRVLITQRRDNGRWEPPGGVLELEETIEEGLRREVLEETGVEVEPIRLTGIYKNMTLGVVALVFRARMVGGEPGPTDETIQVEWVEGREAAKRMPGVYAIRVLDALDGTSPIIRHHDGVTLLPMTSTTARRGS